MAAGLATAPTGYYTFGGGSAEVTRGKAGPIATRYTDGSLMRFTVWDSQVDGNQITDLLDHEGATLPGTVSPIPDESSIDEGLILFYAPSDYAAVFLDRGIPGSVRIALWAREVAASMPVFIDKANTAIAQSAGALSQVQAAVTASTQAKATADGVAAQQDQWMSQSATIEELTATVQMTGNYSEQLVWAAPFGAQIISCAAVFKSGHAPSGTDYLTLTLAKRTAAAPATAVPIATKASDLAGEGVVAWMPWDFSGAAWDPTAAQFAAGDVLTISGVQTGTPALGTPALTIRYRPS